jgi:putative N-acetyltransferase (TIGR04045 family)
MDAIVFRRVDSVSEQAGYFAVRRAIFVEEQGLFHGSDVDEYDSDPTTLHLAAVSADGSGGAGGGMGGVVGAVRCYTTGDDVWYGGRLAVLADYRRHPAAIGPNLCRLAEASVIERGCRRFLAYIQMQNVRFFDRLGWSSVGEPADYHGQLHQLMAASMTITHFEPIEAGRQTIVHA